jgi:hypothetical protein
MKLPVSISLLLLSINQMLDASKIEYAHPSEYFLKHPFGDVYTVVDPNPSEKYLRSVASLSDEQSIEKSERRSAAAALPAIENKPNTQRTGRRSAGIFPTQLNLEDPNYNFDSASSDSSRSSKSHDISDLTSMSTELATTKSLTSEEESLSESEISLSGSSKFSKKFSRKKSISSTISDEPAVTYNIPPMPEIWVTNQQNRPVQITMYFHTPFDEGGYQTKSGYNRDDTTTYTASSQKFTIQPGQQIKALVPLYSKLPSIQIAYNPVVEAIKMRNPIFQSRQTFNLAAHNLNVGEKQYAHDIVINDDKINIDQITRKTKTHLLDLPFAAPTPLT